MEYSVGQVGRVVVARLFEGEDLHACIDRIARETQIRCAAVLITGGFRTAAVVVGPEQEKPQSEHPGFFRLPVPVRRTAVRSGGLRTRNDNGRANTETPKCNWYNRRERSLSMGRLAATREGSADAAANRHRQRSEGAIKIEGDSTTPRGVRSAAPPGKKEGVL